MQNPDMMRLMSDPESMADLMSLQQTFQRLSSRAPGLFNPAAGAGLSGAAATTPGTTAPTGTDTTTQPAPVNTTAGGTPNPTASADIYSNLAQQFAQAMATQNQTVCYV